MQVDPLHVGQRNTWATLPDRELLAQCDCDTYRASGPGGQKRNKTSSAVRLRHRPSGLLVIAEESRSQHENKAKALQRLRRTLCLELREYFLPNPEIFAEWRGDAASLKLRVKDERYLPLAAILLDGLVSVGGKVSVLAQDVGLTTGNLVALLEQETHVWQAANQIRVQYGQKRLKTSDD